MTRQEAYERNNCGDDEIVDIIFDDFENKICKNCKYHKDTQKSYKECDIIELGTSNSFGCTLFERVANANKTIKQNN